MTNMEIVMLAALAAEEAEAQEENLLFTIVVLVFQHLDIKESIPVRIVVITILWEATSV